MTSLKPSLISFSTCITTPVWDTFDQAGVQCYHAVCIIGRFI
ncbi:hypothetical protein QWZ13_05350 [Reinekea marina]|nr:hypothetical protein [Reinekea marina]MDN3648331.1 hypothetical protein [Reinekea marina]